MVDAACISPLARYVQHLKRGELAYQYSVNAQKPVFYPRVVCPYTGTGQLEWRVSKGLGTVYATTYVQPREGTAYNVSLIDVDEGFRLMSRVESIPPQDVRIGMRVAVRIREQSGDELPYPVFVPVDSVP
jgi:uncharacterized OB-fold protein